MKAFVNHAMSKRRQMVFGVPQIAVSSPLLIIAFYFSTLQLILSAGEMVLCAAGMHHTGDSKSYEECLIRIRERAINKNIAN